VNSNKKVELVRHIIPCHQN